MVLLILGVLILGVALIALKVVSVLAGIALMLIGLFAAIAIGDRHDRARQRGPHDPASRFDPDRGVFPTPTESLPGDPARQYHGSWVDRPPDSKD